MKRNTGLKWVNIEEILDSCLERWLEPRRSMFGSLRILSFRDSLKPSSNKYLKKNTDT